MIREGGRSEQWRYSGLLQVANYTGLWYFYLCFMYKFHMCFEKIEGFVLFRFVSFRFVLFQPKFRVSMRTLCNSKITKKLMI